MAAISAPIAMREATLTRHVERGIEFLWLLTAAVIPLIFVTPDFMLSEAVNAYVEVPKTTALRTLAGLMAMLWILEWVLKGRLNGRLGKWVLLLATEIMLIYFTGIDGLFLLTVHVFLLTFLVGALFAFGLGTFNLLPYVKKLRGWVVDRPSRILVVAATVYVMANILATLFSQNFWISVWGEVSGQFGYSAYTTASYFILFSVVVSHLKTSAQLWRLLGVIVATGTLLAMYGVVQHYDLDPLNLGEVGADRISATMANPVFAGATYVITSLMIIGIGLTVLERLGWHFIRVGVWVALIATQLLVVFWTEARGSWIIGVPSGMLAFLILAPLAAGFPSITNWGYKRYILSGLLVLLAGIGTLGQLILLGQIDPPAGLSGTQILLGVIVLAGLVALLDVSGPPGWLGALFFLGQFGLLLLLYFLDSLVFIGWLVPVLSLSLIKTLAPSSSSGSDFKLGAIAKAVLVLALGLQVALAVVFLTPDPSEEAGVGQIQERVADITSASSQRGVSFRTDIWSASAELVFERPWFGFEDPDYLFMPMLTGYGPELFKYTFPLTSPLGGLLSQAHNFFLHHAVEQGILGFLASVGLFAAFFGVGLAQLWNNRNTYSNTHKWILITLLATMVGRLAEIMVGVSREPDLVLTWVMFAILVVLPSVMRGENGTQITGKRCPSCGEENLPEAVACSACSTPLEVPDSEAPTPAISRRERRRGGTRRGQRQRRAGSALGQLTFHQASGAILVSVVLVFVGWLTWDKNVDYAWAATLAASARDDFSQGRFQDGHRLMSQAIDKAPDVPPYYHNVAGIYDAYRRFGQNNPAQRLPTCAEFYGLDFRPPQSDQPYARCAEEAYLANLAAFEKNRTVPQTRLTLANSTMELALMGYEGKGDEAILYFEELTQMFVAPWNMYNAMGNAYVRLGRFSEALVPLDKSLAITTGDSRSAQALFLKGFAIRNVAEDSDRNDEQRLTDLQTAAGHFQQSLEASSQGSNARQARQQLINAYTSMAGILIQQARDSEEGGGESLAREALAVLDKSLAITQESSSSGTPLYFQGLAYQQLGQTQQAVESFERSLSLEEDGQYSTTVHQLLDRLYAELEQHALSLFHRGMTQTRLNNREHAIDAFERSLAASGDSAVADEVRTRLVSSLNDFALARMQENQAQEALDLLEKSLAITQDSRRSGTAFYIQGVAYRALDEVENAVASLERSLELDGTGSNAANVHLQLADVFEAQGNQAKADEHTRLSEELNQS